MQPLFLFIIFFLFSCNQGTRNDRTLSLNLKRGSIISCSPGENQYGEAELRISCPGVQEEFNMGVQILHSFEYDEAEKVFASILDREPGCAMAFWGVAMANFHPLWSPPSPAELAKGAEAVSLGLSLASTEKERAYLKALSSFYENVDSLDHATRCIRFERAMGQLAATYPDDAEASIFYALSLIAAADLADKTYSRQKQAVQILEQFAPRMPNHPGIIHYLIHAHDYPEMASGGLAAARKYAATASSSAHALHMPSHIFTRLGYWDECISSNRVSLASARCYAEQAGMKGSWDEELHALDYLTYAFLQKGMNDSAGAINTHLHSIKVAEPLNFKVAYAFAAIPSRLILENRAWDQALQLTLSPAWLPWEKFPWQQSMLHFTRLLGLAHAHRFAEGYSTLKKMHQLRDILRDSGDLYKANQVEVLCLSGRAWLSFLQGKKNDGLRDMNDAAKLEEESEKHSVTPGEIYPAREQLADMYMLLHQPADALKSYEMNLRQRPGKLNALFNAGRAAAKTGNTSKAVHFFRSVVEQTPEANGRQDMREHCLKFLAKHENAKRSQAPVK